MRGPPKQRTTMGWLGHLSRFPTIGTRPAERASPNLPGEVSPNWCAPRDDGHVAMGDHGPQQQDHAGGDHGLVRHIVARGARIPRGTTASRSDMPSLLVAHLNCVGVTLLPIHFRRFGNSRSAVGGWKDCKRTHRRTASACARTIPASSKRKNISQRSQPMRAAQQPRPEQQLLKGESITHGISP